MPARTERATILATMPSEWSFSFWQERYEQAEDLPSKIGLLGAASDLKGKPDELIVYLMGIADGESVTDEHTRALAGKAVQTLHRVLEKNKGFHSDSINWTSLAVVEKALWFSRPAKELKWLVNRLNGTGEEEKYVRRYLRNVCTLVWQGRMKYAVPAHKQQVLDIFYASGRLMEYVPPPEAWEGTPGWWGYFADVLPRLEELARLDFRLAPTIESIEEAAFFGSRAAYVFILARAVLPAGKAFYERGELRRLRARA